LLVYDLEILKAIPDKDGQSEAGIAYCEGWNDYQGMGIAVICCYDYATDRYRVFCQDNLTGFKTLVSSAQCVVGYNNHRFDDNVLEAAGITVPPEKSYDILQEIWRGLGLDSDFKSETHRGYGLEALCVVNLGITKNGSGALAPILWQRGQVGTVIDYCLQDVHLTKKLLDRIIQRGALASPKDEQRTIYVRKPGVDK
jgi:hypothetical protein